MKKSLIALAALATVATAAQAQSSVSVYGIMDGGIVVDNHSATGSSTKFASDGVLATSRLGFKGTEDLGGGLKANFNLESAISDSTGAGGSSVGTTAGTGDAVSSLFDRQAWVGLESSIGQVQLGRSTRFDFDAAVTNDPFGAANFGGAAHVVFGAISYNGRAGSNTSRFVNAAKFTSARVSGFQVGYQHSFGGAAGDADKSTGQSYAANYAQGAARLDYSYARQNDANGIKENESTVIAGSYDLGVAKLFAGYGEREKAGVSVKTKATYVGATVPVNAKVKAIAQYSDLKDTTADAPSATAAAGSPTAGYDATVWALGLTYDFSKRTTAYALVGGANNEPGAKIRATTRGATADAGRSSTAYAFGIRHNF